MVATPDRNYLVYCIRASASSERTYVGCTNNWKRRLRQHCGIIKGGARFTRGTSTWRPIFHVQGLTKREALQLEWAIKHRRHPGVAGVRGRWLTLQGLMKRDRWTRNAPPLKEIRSFIKIVRFG
jgi:predicted GIY-YIG superfamily endonuclease